jgi:hypothetical protein
MQGGGTRYGPTSVSGDPPFVDLRTGAAKGPANPIPYDQAVHDLRAGDDLRRQPRMDAAPDVMPRIGSRIRANRPDHEFLYVRRSLEDVGVVPVEAPLELDGGLPAVEEFY